MKNKIAFVFLIVIFLAIVGLMLHGCGSAIKTTPTTSQWTILNALTRGKMIYAIHGTSANNIFAVGEGGNLLKYDGSDWLLIETATSEAFYRLWSPSPDVVYLLGSDRYIKKYSNGNLSIEYTDPDPTQHLATITGFSDSDIYVGGIGAMYHYDGTSWSTMEIDTDAYIFGLWGTDSNNLYAVDLDGAIHFYNGSSWVKQAELVARFNSVHGTATNDVYAVSLAGDYMLYHYDGTTWAGIDNSLLPGGSALYEVWGSASDDIYVVGDKGRIIHYNGTSWEQIFDIPAREYQAVWGTSASNVLIAGENGILLRKNGSSWTEELGEYRGFFDGIYGTSSTNMYFGGYVLKSGSAANAMHYDGSTLTPVETGSVYDIRGFWGDGSNRFFAITEKIFNSQILQFNGSSWSTDYQVSMSLTDIWGSSLTDIYAVGYDKSYDSKIFHYDGLSWSTLESLSNEIVFDISGGASNEVYFRSVQDVLGSETPILYLYNGVTLKSVSLPSGDSIQSIHYLSGTGLYVGIKDVLAYKLYLYNGAIWTELGSVGYDIKAIWASASNNVYLGTAGGVHRYNGSTIAGPMYPYCDNCNRIWGTDANNIYLVGDHGIIMRYGQ
ncbi:MAG: hypothetical protein HQ564_00140 [Candidatus Saganbacteria bacterium]|nr:hypothetical protein [Candidatus Saganbacteria bacterium]